MSLADIEFDRGPRAYRGLEEWEKRLSIPARTLLHHATQGNLSPFITLPLTMDSYFLVRTDPSAEPLSQPSVIPLSKSEIIAFIPNENFISAMILNANVTINSFDKVITRNLYWDRIRGLHPSAFNHPFKPEGWRIEAHSNGNIARLHEDGGYSTPLLFPANGETPEPVSFNIRPNDIYIYDNDIKAFLHSLKTYQFISDLYSSRRGAEGEVSDEGKATDGEITALEITRCLPPYLSGKLQEMIEANQIIWRKHKKMDRTETDRKRAAMLEYLGDDFLKKCDKKSKPDALVEFASQACDPTLVPALKQLKSHVTPDLLALVTAAKLFWSPVYIDLGASETHPSREATDAFLKFMGMTEPNAASRGSTIIRPESASTRKSKTLTPFFSPPIYWLG